MTLSDMRSRVLERLNESTSTPVYYAASEVTAALNEAQRLFALLTLGLETTATFPLPANTTFFHMRSTFEDWLLPLRVYLPGGANVRPARLEDLDALDSNWQSTPGTPSRYVSLGFDFFAVYAQSNVDTSLQITYARAPRPLVGDGDVPEVPEEFHPAQVDYGVYRCRMKEGGQEFAKTLPYFNRYLDEAQRYGKYVLARNMGSRYDARPFELERFDRSKLLKFRTDLVPAKKGD